MSLLVPPQCEGIVNLVNLVVQSIGLDYDFLCPANGTFSEGVRSVEACISSYSTASGRVLATLIETAEDYCSANVNGVVATTSTFSSVPSVNSASKASVQSSVCCGSDQGLKLLANCTQIITASIAQCAAFSAALSSQSVSTSATPSPGQTTQTLSSPTQTLASSQASASSPSSNSNSPNVGLIAGAAVGATIGFFLLISLIGCIIWRRRKQRKARELQAATARSAEPEKAQLHSEDVKPRREELPGSPVVLVRSVGGLAEMEGTSNLRKPGQVRELPANEEVGSEMTTELSKGGTSSRS